MQILNFLTNTYSGIGPRAREVNSRDRERMFFLMAMMLKSGQTTEGCLRAVSKAFKSEKKEDISAALQGIAVKVSQGRSLSKAAESEYILFGDIHRAAMLAGELSNRMQESFAILQKLEDKKIAASRSGLAELLTPAALLLMSFVSLFNTGLNTLPIMADVAKQRGKQLPVASEIVLDFTSFCAEYWYLLMTGFVLMFIFIYSSYKSSQGRYWLDTYTLQIPVLGEFIRYKIYSSMLLYFPHLIQSGVKPKQMIPIMEALTTNVALRRRIDQFNQVITTGGQMSQAMEKAGFPGIAVTPVAISEHYVSKNDNINDAMIEGMNHSHTIMERILNDTHKRFITVFSTILWIFGGGVMLLEMLSIVLAQN